MVIHLGLTILIIIISSIHKDKVRRRRCLPIILLLLFYWALMYDYGLDYWNYYNIFYYDPHYGDDRGEPIFWSLFFSFHSFYLFVFFYANFLAWSIYYFVKHNIPPNYYGFFFLIFMLHPSLCLNMTYVMRSAVGSCIVWIALSKFYIKKVNFACLYMTIGVAALCQHTLALCFMLPIAGYVLKKIPSPFIFAALIVALWLGANQSMELFTQILSGMDSFESYAHYGADRINKEVSFLMIASRALHLVPAFFILYYRNINEYTKRLCGICMCYYFVYFIGFDLLGRLTMMLYVFIIICSVMIADGKKWFIKMMILFPSLLFAAYRNVMFYMEMASSHKGKPGDMLEYKTIMSILF